MKPSFSTIGGEAIVAPGLAPYHSRGGKRLRIALAGYGVVGQSLAELLRDEPAFEVTSILIRNPARLRTVPAPAPLTTDSNAFLAAPADILVDVLSCAETGVRLCADALSRGVHVASASKRVVSVHHSQLHAAARRSGVQLLNAAAVGGGAPVLETVAAAAARGPVSRVSGILNGTVNFLLTRLAAGQSFGEALAEARCAGFAEEDPSEDLSGADAAAKLRLIAAQAFGLNPALLCVDVEPLDPAAAERIADSGERWVQLSMVERDGDWLRASVRLRRRRDVPHLPAVDDEWNCAVVELASGERLECSGPGAGGTPTAGAILEDLRRISVEQLRNEPPMVLAC